jgi:hypothetical protein
MMHKALIAAGVAVIVLGVVMAILPQTETRDFSASEFSFVGSEYVAPSVYLPAGVIVTVKWQTDSFQMFGTPSCALAMKDSSGDYDVLASGEGKSGSFTYGTAVGGDYYILQKGMTMFTSGTVSVSYTFFPLVVVGAIVMALGVMVAGIGFYLNRRSQKVTVIYTQAPPMSYPPQYPLQAQQGVVVPPGQQYTSPPQYQVVPQYPPAQYPPAPQYQAPPGIGQEVPQALAASRPATEPQPPASQAQALAAAPAPVIYPATPPEKPPASWK